ncbi:MAG: alpha/beta fold hydrolase [Alphaproteobacteria bacterium]|nr:alpha/beta fold hydrolase [Alphaproteobacteria bacterium]
MAQTPSLVRDRCPSRPSRRSAVAILAILLLLIAACAPARLQALDLKDPPMPDFEPEASRFISFDGAELGLTVWPAQEGAPEIVIVGLHGMNDYANAFHMAAPWWAARGVTTYAYDQRGFGRSPGRGIWPDEDLLREDLRTAVEIARRRHPEARIAVVGISMGAAVAMTAFASERPPEADRLILSGPGLRGWGALPVLYRVSLWTSVRMRPGWIVTPPRRFVKIMPSDNLEMLRWAGQDRLRLFENRIDQVHGVVALMERAHDRADELPGGTPTLLSYGANDIVIPPGAMARTAPVLPGHVRTVFYEDGYHMLLRDLQAETVFADYLAFLKAPDAPLPSGEGPLPWRQTGTARYPASAALAD